MLASDDRDLEDIEIALLLEGVFRRYGSDFREYARTSIARRIRKCMSDEQLATVSGLQEKVLHDPACMERLLLTLSIDTTAMYRDPAFYLGFRERVVPLLRTYPFVRIWHAGCASGEEVYSMAILLEEEGLYDRCRLYATDINQALLERARTGIFPIAAMREYTTNYVQGGGHRAFSEYYTARYDGAIFRPQLQRNIIWAQHNLVTDGVFNTFQTILCRNVMIYFSKPLQGRVHKLLYDSLEPFGVLALGSKESLQFTPLEGCYEMVDGAARAVPQGQVEL